METRMNSSVTQATMEVQSDRRETVNENAGVSIMVLNNKHGLCEDLKYVISLQELCDVTFLVGPEKKPVYGIRAIMATRSRVLYQLLLTYQNIQAIQSRKRSSIKQRLRYFACLGSSPRKDSNIDVIHKLTIQVPEFDAESFDRLMSYIHCGTVTVTPETVVGLLNGAQRFNLPELRKACWDFAISCMRDKNRLGVLLATAKNYGKSKTTKVLMDKVKQYLNTNPEVLDRSQELQELADICFAKQYDRPV